jgi:putative spermidine/putrescine transport system substrate-binding protein
MDRRIVRSGGLSRRSLMKRAGLGAGAVLIPTFISACGSDDGGSSTSTSTASAGATPESAELKALLDGIKSKQVVIGSYGGTTEDARKKAYWDPFTERTGVKVIVADIPGNVGNDMLAGKVPAKWDAFHGSPNEFLTAKALYKGEMPSVPEIAYEDLIPEKFRPYSFASFYVAYVPAVLKGTFPDGNPASWADFYDFEKFPGKRSWPGASYTPGTRESALMADGVAPKDVYPFDMARAVKKIEDSFDNFRPYDQFPQTGQFVTSKTVSVGFGPNGIWKGLQDKGVDLEILWDCTPILQPNTMNVMPKAPNLDAVQALAAFCKQPDRAAEFFQMTNYGPTTQAAFDAMPKDVVAGLPNAPGRTALTADVEYLAKVEGEILQQNKEIFS